MPFKKGDPLINRTGRPFGAKNKIRRLSNEERVAIVKQGDLTPLQLMQSVAMDSEVDLEVRLMAAKDVAPYIHRKMPIAVEGGEKPIAVLSADRLATMSDKELSALNAALIGLGVASGQEED